MRWLGFGWEGEPRHASDYFEEMYRYALGLIRSGFAYVDSQSAADIRETRGTLTRPGQASPWRDRPAAESAELFARMRGGKFPRRAQCVLRAKIDMASGNLNLRDPVLYRIRHAPHPHTGDAWCIYPTYDFAQVLSDAIEGVTHSLCTLEFEDHRPALRLDLGPPRPALPGAPPDRVLPSQSRAHGDEQAPPRAARRGGPRGRLERPAHADPARHAAARLPAGRDPAISASGSGSPGRRAAPRWASWNGASATSSTGTPRG